MKLIVAGSRNVTDRSLVFEAINESPWAIETLNPGGHIIHGGCRGVDTLASWVANEWGTEVTVFPADWDAHGKAAGPIRNREMAAAGDALVAVWDGQSRGTANMIAEMVKAGKPVFVWPAAQRLEGE